MEQCNTVGGFIKEDVGFNVFRQQPKNREHETSHTDKLQNVANKSVGDGSISDWYMGFNISLVYHTL